jgi:hypothetical protein
MKLLLCVSLLLLSSLASFAGTPSDRLVSVNGVELHFRIYPGGDSTMLLEAHWDSIAATDFFTVEVLTLRGLVTYYILFVLDLASRTVKIAGVTSRPDEVWMVQIVRNLTDAEEPFLRHTQFLIMDRDTKYAAAFARH